MTKINSTITTILGFGNILRAIVISEFGDINPFNKPSQLVSFTGIDATVCQSGNFEGVHNAMSKRGSHYLRKALFQAAFVASNSDPVLKVFIKRNVLKVITIRLVLVLLLENFVILFLQF